MLINKSALSFRLQVNDSSGVAISRLHHEECSTLEFNFLSLLAETIIGEEIPRERWSEAHPQGLLSALQRVTGYEARDGEQVYDLMRRHGWGLRADQWSRLFSDGKTAETFRLSVKILAQSHVLCVLIPGSPGDEVVVKVESNLRQAWPGKPWRRISRFLGWSAWEFHWIDVPAGDPKSYHCEVWVPPGVEIETGKTGFSPIPPEPQTDFLGKSCFHLMASSFETGKEYALLLNLRVKFSGWLSASLAVCLAVLALLFVGNENSDGLVRAKKNPTGEGAAPSINLTVLLTTIFLAVGAAVITILVKTSSGRHDLDDRMLTGLRMVSWGIVVVCFSAVLILFCANTQESMRNGFGVLINLQFAILALMLAPVAIRIATDRLL
jgi:hypothetical protein